jgi:hypothetical protein
MYLTATVDQPNNTPPCVRLDNHAAWAAPGGGSMPYRFRCDWWRTDLPQTVYQPVAGAAQLAGGSAEHVQFFDMFPPLAVPLRYLTTELDPPVTAALGVTTNPVTVRGDVGWLQSVADPSKALRLATRRSDLDGVLLTADSLTSWQVAQTIDQATPMGARLPVVASGPTGPAQAVPLVLRDPSPQRRFHDQLDSLLDSGDVLCLRLVEAARAGLPQPFFFTTNQVERVLLPGTGGRQREWRLQADQCFPPETYPVTGGTGTYAALDLHFADGVYGDIDQEFQGRTYANLDQSAAGWHL